MEGPSEIQNYKNAKHQFFSSQGSDHKASAFRKQTKILSELTGCCTELERATIFQSQLEDFQLGTAGSYRDFLNHRVRNAHRILNGEDINPRTPSINASDFLNTYKPIIESNIGGRLERVGRDEFTKDCVLDLNQTEMPHEEAAPIPPASQVTNGTIHGIPNETVVDLTHEMIFPMDPNVSPIHLPHPPPHEVYATLDDGTTADVIFEPSYVHPYEPPHYLNQRRRYVRPRTGRCWNTYRGHPIPREFDYPDDHQIFGDFVASQLRNSDQRQNQRMRTYLLNGMLTLQEEPLQRQNRYTTAFPAQPYHNHTIPASQNDIRFSSLDPQGPTFPANRPIIAHRNPFSCEYHNGNANGYRYNGEMPRFYNGRQRFN